MKSNYSSFIDICNQLILIICFILFPYPACGQLNIKGDPDLLPVRESYLLSGRLDSIQYFYFLDGILKEQFDARRETLKVILQSRITLLQHLDRIKSDYLKLLGPMPEKTPLNPVVTGKIEKEHYKVEKVAFESRPFHHVTALLYIPEGKGPFPAILHIPGHSFTAKGRDIYQTIGRYFALNGFVVLQVDPVCQGERCQICQDESTRNIKISGTPVNESTTGQHELYNQGLLLLGSGMVAWEAWDNIRAIDYLCTRSEVDITRIGVTGLSGGGTQTTYLASLDPRIRAIAPSSYIATTEEKFRTIGSQDGCQQLYAEGKPGIEEQDFLFMAAPIPILILSTFDDFFSYKGSKIAAQELRQLYAGLGLEGRARQFSSPGEHGMPSVSLEANVRWMSWWLKGDSSNIIPDTLTDDYIPIEDTYVTKTGQVMTYFKNEKSILDYTVAMFESGREGRINFLADFKGDELARKAADLIGFEKTDKIKGGSYRGAFTWERLKIEKHLINRDRGFTLPALIIKPDRRPKSGTPVLIMSGCFGKMNELACNKQLVLDKLKKGYIIMVLDVSNTGELRSAKKVSGSGVDYEFAVAKMCIYAGKTLLGCRTEDLLIARDYLKTILKVDEKKIELLASEQIGPCAIHAAIIDGGFSKIYLINSPDSWENLIKTHFKPDNIGIIVPNALKYYDLPDLIKVLTDRDVKIETIKINTRVP